MKTESIFAAAKAAVDRFSLASTSGFTAALAIALFAGPAVALSPAPADLGEMTVEAAPGTTQSFQQTITNLTDRLLEKAKATSSGRIALVIDPLIDRDSGAETAGTRTIAAVIEDRVRDHYPNVEMRPFSTTSLAEKPFVLMGSIAPAWKVRSLDLPTGTPRTFYVWAVVVDLRSNRVIALEHAWVRSENANPVPTAFFRDSPIWTTDPSRAVYLKMCSSPAGTVLDAAYTESLSTDAVIANAVRAFDGRDYERALELYGEALKMPSGKQLRVLNGIYLSNVALGRNRDAEKAFADLVDYGLERNRLAVKFLFRVGSTRFWPDPAVSRPYAMWVREIATGAAAHASCLEISGHASPTGSAAANDRLSLARAQRMQALLNRAAPALVGRTAARGLGSRDPIIGTGTDDATDALDRRVEFQPHGCTASSAKNDRQPAFGTAF